MATDIVFSFDTTGSMSPALAEVRRKVSEVIEKLFSSVEDLHIGVITHGDYCDHPHVITECLLTDDQTRLINFVKTAPNTGGGDSDECYEYVLNRALTYNWREGANKVFVLIADAQPHSVGYSYGKYYVTSALDWKVLATKLPENGITVYPVQCLGRHDPKQFYKTLAECSGISKLELHQFTHIVEAITAITIKQAGNEQLQQYADELKSAGIINRGIAAILDALMGKAETPIYTSGELALVPPWRFQILNVDDSTDIKSFVQSTGAQFKKGRGFYELTKPEEVQERKEIVLAYPDGTMYTGAKAREMVGLPYGKRGKLYPNFKDFTVFIQSTSVNRKLVGNTKFLYDTQQ